MENRINGGGRLSSLSVTFRRLCRESFLGGLLISGDADDFAKRTRISEKIRNKLIIPLKRSFGSLCDRSQLVKFGNFILGSVRNVPLRSVGVTYFTFGIFTLLVYLLQRIVFNSLQGSGNFVYGLICLILSGISMTSSQRIGDALSDGLILSFISDRLLLDDRQMAERGGSRRPPHVGTLIFSGIFFGAVSELTSFAFAALLPVFMVLSLKILKQPSFGVMVLLCACPFVGSAELTAVSLFVIASTFFKVLCGKRKIVRSFSGIVVIVIALLVIISGIRGGFGDAVGHVSAMLLFFPVVALFKTEKRIERLAFCLAVPGILISVITVVSFLLTLFNSIPWLPTFEVFAPPVGLIVSLTCVSIPMTVVSADITYVRDLKLVGFFAVVTELAALYLSLGIAALLTGVAVYGITLMTVYRRASGPVLTAAMLLISAGIAFGDLLNLKPSASGVFFRLVARLPVSLLVFGGGFGPECTNETISEMTGIQIPPTGLEGVSSILMSVGLIGGLFAALVATACVLNALKLSISSNVAGEHRVIAAGCASAVIGCALVSLMFDPFSATAGTALIFCCIGASKAVDELSAEQRQLLGRELY
ncbi:MAG: hypothetical protein IKX86_06165 [Clostridia bacterium]|nr:hypothetical protein [Clostridia bacterium]